MKSRKKINLPNKPVLKRSESNIDKNRLDKPPKRNFFSSISLQQNLEFFQQESALFSKPIPNCGDADSYFKQTLRNYDYFDLNQFRRTTHLLKSARSLQGLKKRKSVASLKQKKKPKSLSKSSSLKTSTSASHTSSARSKATTKSKRDTEDPDVDIFYSPSSYTLSSSKGSSHTLQNKQSQSSLAPESEQIKNINNFEEKTLTNMADEEEHIEEFAGIGGPRPSRPSPRPSQAPAAMPAPPPETETEEEEEEESDALKEVEQIIKQASEELAEVTEENQQLFGGVMEGAESEKLEFETTEEEESDRGSMKAGGDGSIFKFDPAIDAAVLRELEEAEKQAKATAKIIYELKTRVTELLKKEKHTEAEARELEEKNRELRAQMILFEEKTKRIQFLITQTNLFDKMISPEAPLQMRHNEDVLPKVVVCGMTEHNIPKLILCDDKKRRSRSPQINKDVNIPMSVVPKFAKRLSDSYTMQERLAAENADLEGMRYKLQSDLLSKDQTIEYLQRKLCTIQCEMRVLCKENSVLNDKIQQVCGRKQQEIVKPKKMPCGKGKGPCPAEIEGRLNEYSETTKLLEKQLCDMENDVKSMQTELCAVQAEREHLEQHKKVIICPPICHSPCSPCPPPCSPCIMPCSEQQLRELREQYCRLQDDFKGKVIEVAGLRADNEKLKANAKEAEEARKALDEKVKDLERTLKSLKTDNNKFLGSKEQLIEQEQQLAVAKQRFREAQDELEELRSFIQDQQGQLDDYRNKYLEAQQEVEEQRRQIDMLEMDANRVNEQVNLEIQRVKNQFQEKLQELLPLPDILKSTQMKLQETQQMHMLAERNNDALQRDLQMYKDKIAEITDQMDKVRSDNQLGQDEKTTMSARLEELEAKVNELEEENFNLKQEMAKLEETLEENDRELQSKLHEIAQLSAQLESVREESARQVARNKERCETVRRSMQNQISDLERQLAQSRAQARTAQKDRDEIRQKMQSQINNLHENFEDAQMRIRSLQGHVNFLKESYHTTTVPGVGDADTAADHNDPCNCGREF